MSIAKITDTGSHILLASTLTDAANVTSPIVGPAGVVNGTASFNNGMNPGTAGSVSFANIDPDGVLRHAGQIVITVTTGHVCEYDDSTAISGSEGVDWAAAAYILALEDSAGVDNGRIYISAVEKAVIRLHISDTPGDAQITSYGKGATTELCLAWAGSDLWLLADGVVVYTAVRANVKDDVFYKLIIGAAYNTTANPINGATLTNLIVSRIPPNFATKHNAVSLGCFGDSYANYFLVTSTTPRFDGTIEGGIRKAIAKGNTYGLGRVFKDGYSGYTMCDTGLKDLQPKFVSFVAQQPQIALVLACQNDCVIALGSTTTAKSVLHATTGTEARYKELLGLLANEQSNELIVITITGSLRQKISVDTTTNRATQVVVDKIIVDLVSWFDATYPARAGSLILFDLKASAGGDVDGNLNYQGALNVIGNVSTPGVASANDRHLSGLGGYNVGYDLGKEIKRIMQL